MPPVLTPALTPVLTPVFTPVLTPAHTPAHTPDGVGCPVGACGGGSRGSALPALQTQGSQEPSGCMRWRPKHSETTAAQGFSFFTLARFRCVLVLGYIQFFGMRVAR